ncbi:MAG: hypothetical protein ACE5DL_02545 [Nitrosopumilaceae archaeon]
MAKIKITDRLSGALSETYFKEYCDQNGWAFSIPAHFGHKKTFS